MSVARQIRGNIIDVVDGATRRPQGYRASLPPSVQLDGGLRPRRVRAATPSPTCATRSSSAACSPIFVLIVFLRDWRVTIIAAISLPLTMVGTFFVLQLVGGTINLMSMGGLAIAIGLVIDDAIVVVENIHRHRAAGETVAVAAEKGTQELVAAVIGSTLTTVVVFVPLGLLQGVVGQFFAALSLDAGGGRAAVAGLRAAVHPRRGRRGSCSDARRGQSRAARTAGCRAATRSLLRRALKRPALVDRGHAWPSRGSARAALLPAGDRLPAGDGRGRLRRRLLDADRHVAARDRPDGQARRDDPDGHARGARASRGAPARSWACSRRRRTPATSSSG